jgi:hypothetical protein
MYDLLLVFRTDRKIFQEVARTRHREIWIVDRVDIAIRA